jgi:hypothetical protein
MALAVRSISHEAMTLPRLQLALLGEIDG